MGVTNTQLLQLTTGRTLTQPWVEAWESSLFYSVASHSLLSLLLVTPFNKSFFSWQSKCHASLATIVCLSLNYAWGKHGSFLCTTMRVTNTQLLWLTTGRILTQQWVEAWESSLFYSMEPTNEHLPFKHQLWYHLLGRETSGKDSLSS